MPLPHRPGLDHAGRGVEELLEKGRPGLPLPLLVLEGLEDHVELVVVLGEAGVKVTGFLVLIAPCKDFVIC